MKILIGIILISILFAANSYAVDSANKILKKVDNNLSPESYVSYRKLINIEPNGRKKQFVFYFLKKGRNKVAIIYLKPQSDKGRTSLRLGDNFWLYLPSVRKPVRIASLQSSVGGIFNNSDILALDYTVEYNASFLSKSKNQYVLKLKAKTKNVAYDVCKMWVDRKRLIPIKIECYTRTKIMVKTIFYKKVKNFGDGIIAPSVIETTSPMYKGYRSIMIKANVKKKALPDEYFTLHYMSKLGDIPR